LKKSFLYKLILCALIVFVFQFSIGVRAAFANPDKNVIVVLDTSMSMIGHGGKFFGRDILEPVKQSINRFIDKQIDDGDTVTFMTFDTDVKSYPTVIIYDENDRDIVKKYISMVEAKGKWTNTFSMIRGVEQKAKELEELDKKKDKERQIVIIVMTDGLDDPAPDSKQKMSIEEIGKQQADWWFYIVDLKGLIDNTKYLEHRKKLEEKASKLSKNVKIIQVDDKDKSMGMDAVAEDSEKKIASSSFARIIQILIAVLVVCALLALVFFMLQYSKLKVKGKLDYWNNEVLDPYITHFDLAKKELREITIGKGASCDLVIRDLGVSKPFSIKAVRLNKEIKFAITAGAGYKIEFVNKKPDGFVKAGDIFKVNNFTFKLFND